MRQINFQPLADKTFHFPNTNPAAFGLLVTFHTYWLYDLFNNFKIKSTEIRRFS